jgi:hypothetical protein
MGGEKNCPMLGADGAWHRAWPYGADLSVPAPWLTDPIGAM